MATLNFNAQTVAPSTGQLDAMPKGWYNALIESSETKPTSKGDGSYLELKFNIVSGRFQNRKVFARLNLNNPNPVAQEIAYKDLSAICHATGILSVQESSQLHNIPLKIRLKVRKGNDEYDDNNEISAFKNINEQVKLADDENPAPGGAAGGYQQMPAQQMPPQQMPPQQQLPQQYQQQPPVQQQQMPPQQQLPQQYQQQPPVQQQAPIQQPMQQQPPQYQQAQQPWQQPDQQQYQQQPQQYQQPQQPPMDQPPQMQQQQYQQQPPVQQQQQAPVQQMQQQPPVQQQQQMPQQQPQQPYNGAQLNNPQAAIPPWQQPQ